ncbi:radical SAM protein [Candidatus Woesearchaeota archaeon]|nr:radical SAM protein [Candidatus Woesearchaeota archaeon]
MVQVNLQIYNKCNQSCFFCQAQNWIKEGKMTETTEDAIRKRIEKAAYEGNSVLFSGGGEATTLGDLPGLIRYAKSIGVKETVLETNAVRLSDVDYANELKNSGLDRCIVSIHSHKAEISDAITQAPGTFIETIKGMKNIIEVGIKFDAILHTITKLNYKDLPIFIDFIHRIFPNIRNINLSFVRPFEENKKSCDLTPSYTEAQPYILNAFELCAKKSIGLFTSPTLGIPPCFLNGFEQFSGELRNYALAGEKAHQSLMSNYNKIKPEKCKSCSFDKYCSGIEASYAALYGTDELMPLTKDPEKYIGLIRNQLSFENNSNGSNQKQNEKSYSGNIKKHNLGRLEINRFCNQRCVFCSNPPKGGELGFDEIKKRMLKMKDEGVTDLMITGGEPTLKRDLAEILELAQSLDFDEITIQTNGSTLHTEDRVKMLSRFREILKVNVSFHASDRELFGELSQAPHTYDNTLKSLENLGKYNISTHITIVIQKSNYRHLKSHIQFIRKNFPFIRHFSFNFIDPIYNAWENKWTVPTFTESEKYIHEAFEYIIGSNCTFRIEKMPLCHLRGFEHYQSNLRRHLFDETRVCSFLRIKSDYDYESFLKLKPLWKKEEGKSEFFYAPQCSECNLKTICPGINSNYVMIHGYKEARPVFDRDPQEILQLAVKSKADSFKIQNQNFKENNEGMLKNKTMEPQIRLSDALLL